MISKLHPNIANKSTFYFRFDYDFEREVAVKFNDYFEFPRELDMEPYTGKRYR